MTRNDELSARRFTTSAIHIVEQLWPRAVDRGMSSGVTVETVRMLALWSILRWERKVGLVVLERKGVAVDDLAQDVNRALDAACSVMQREGGNPRLQTLPSGQRGIVLDFRAPLIPLLDAAEQEASGLGHDWVGSEHLLLAIIRAADPRLREVLDQHQVVYAEMRQVVLEVLQS